MKADGSMKITDIVRKWPQTADIFIKYHMGCIGCLLGETETLENGARMHGLNLESLINEINDLITVKNMTR